jgi:hypothetical protein
MEIGWSGVDWIGLAPKKDQWRALVNKVMNLRGSIKCWETLQKMYNWRPLPKGSAAITLVHKKENNLVNRTFFLSKSLKKPVEHE